MELKGSFLKVSFNDIKGGINLHGCYSINSFYNKMVFMVMGVECEVFNLIKREMQKVAEEAMIDCIEIQYPIYTDTFDGIKLNTNNEYLILPHNEPKSWFRGREFRYMSCNYTTYLTISYQNGVMNFNICYVPPIPNEFNELESDQLIFDIRNYLGTLRMFSAIVTHIDPINNVNNTKDNYSRVAFGNSTELTIINVLLRHINIGDKVTVYRTIHGLTLALLT